MKLSEIDNTNAQHTRILQLRDERRDHGNVLASIEAGDALRVTTDACAYEAYVHNASRPVFRAAIEQSIACIEQELTDLGVDIDEPAFMPEEDDSEGAVGEDAPSEEEGVV